MDALKTEISGFRQLDGGSVHGFALVGSDGVAAWAEGTIDGDAVMLRSPQIAHPVAVGYDWADNPDGNLRNGANLPAAPFRTNPGVLSP